jgi:outer membrane protein
MKNSIIAWVALAAALAGTAWNIFNRPPRVGYAETAVLMAEFSEAIKAKHRFEEAQKEWDKNLKSLNDSLLAAMDRMKAQFDIAGKAGKDSLRRDFEGRNDDYQRYVEAVKKMSQEKEQELMNPVIRKMNSYMEIWGKQHGYDLILGTMQGGNILQADTDLNLTSRILKDLNEQYVEFPLEKPANAPTDSGRATADAKANK